MFNFFKAVGGVLLFTVLGFSQIQNHQFKDLDGNEYDLYTLLDEGKHIYVQMIFNG